MLAIDAQLQLLSADVHMLHATYSLKGASPSADPHPERANFQTYPMGALREPRVGTLCEYPMRTVWVLDVRECPMGTRCEYRWVL